MRPRAVASRKEQPAKDKERKDHLRLLRREARARGVAVAAVAVRAKSESPRAAPHRASSPAQRRALPLAQAAEVQHPKQRGELRRCDQGGAAVGEEAAVVEPQGPQQRCAAPRAQHSHGVVREQ
mmetsp:Transcript_26714/g.53691  ORF Transcript_26714/g.53691 Transcript_26714/m.53691 type:complete len:124 (-) Transcript_26714:379-750(-)